MKASLQWAGRHAVPCRSCGSLGLELSRMTARHSWRHSQSSCACYTCSSDQLWEPCQMGMPTLEVAVLILKGCCKSTEHRQDSGAFQLWAHAQVCWEFSANARSGGGRGGYFAAGSHRSWRQAAGGAETRCRNSQSTRLHPHFWHQCADAHLLQLSF